MSDLEKLNIQLQALFSRSKKIEDMIGLNKITGNRWGLGSY